MPQIIPIKELKDTAKVSELCHQTSEPIFITKNGYGDMVLMSMESYEEMHRREQVYRARRCEGKIWPIGFLFPRKQKTR